MQAYLLKMLIAAGLVLAAVNGHAGESEELRQFRELIEQQQRIIEQQQQRDAQQQQEIELLKQQVRALQDADRETDRVAAEADQQVGEPGQGVAQAPGTEVRPAGTVTIQGSQQGIGDWTRLTLGAPPPDTVVTEDLETSAVVIEPEGFSVSIGGHISRAVNVANDGDKTKSYFVDNGNVPTLAYLKASAPVNDDLTLGGHIETALQDNSANAVSQDNESSGFNNSARHFELTADSDRYGKFWFGKGFASAFYLAEIDKSGTYAPNLASVGNTAGGLKFFDTGTNSLSGITVAEVFFDIEGINLINRARYDSPVWKGFRLSADAGEDQYSDVALRWSGDVGDFAVSYAGAASNNPQGKRVSWRTDSALGILHEPTGLNLSFGAARQGLENSSKNSDGFLVRAGLRRNWFDIGETKTAIDYTSVWDITDDGDKGRSAGAFLVQEINEWNMELYTGYRWYDLDRDDRDLDDIDVFNFGARYWFDMTARVPKP